MRAFVDFLGPLRRLLYPIYVSTVEFPSPHKTHRYRSLIGSELGVTLVAVNQV
ncbi:MAG: hypothetical protein QOJ64_2456 [Acidobacteriota bacterium]|jgi:hypothetical protein|nr:hypothetical protein [Acidobacteriota bacterium]